MKYRFLFVIILLSCLMYPAPFPLHAEITESTPLNIRILVDNSGSMYPGYRLDSGTSKRSSGVEFFHEYPKFKEWMLSLIQRQGELNAKNIEMSAFTEDQIEELLPWTNYDQIGLQSLDAGFEKLRKTDGKFKWGKTTELRANLEKYVKDFEGILWLITDNIIETKQGSHDYEDIKDFFETIRDKFYYKSVHLYKYPFRDVEKNQDSNLAIYGMLVSPDPAHPGVIAHFDKKFRSLSSAFPGGGRLQLKDPEIGPIEINSPEGIAVDILKRKGGLFKTTQKVRLRIHGSIKSNLTHHTITDGTYRMSIDGPFKADPKAVKEFGVPSGISSNKFRSITGSTGHIPPEGQRSIMEELTSNQEFTLRTKGIAAFIKSAFGMQVHYNGVVKLEAYNLKVNFERVILAGVYGINAASEVFNFQDFKEIKNVRAQRDPITFTLRNNSFSALVLLLAILLILLALGFGGWFMFGDKEVCEIHMGSDKKVIAFRRMGRHALVHDGARIGDVYRGMGKIFTFSAHPTTSGLTVKVRKNESGIFDVSHKNTSFVLVIKPQSKGNVRGKNFSTVDGARIRKRGGNPVKNPHPLRGRETKKSETPSTKKSEVKKESMPGSGSAPPKRSSSSPPRGRRSPPKPK